MKRRSIFLTLILGCGILAVTLAVFLLTFDLDRYRPQVEAALSSVLKQPVRLGRASLSLRPGPALAFTDVHLDLSGDISGDLTIGQLFLKLEVVPLLQGRLVFSEVLLDRPSIHLTRKFAPPANEQLPSKLPAESAPIINPAFLESTMIRSLRWDNGAIFWAEVLGAEKSFRVTAENLHGGISNLSWREGLSVEFFGDLSGPGKKTSFSLHGSIDPAANDGNWKNRTISLDLTVDRLDPAPWLDRFLPPGSSLTSTGVISLHLAARGAWRKGLKIEGQLRSDGLLVAHKNLAGPLPAVRELAYQGLWNPETSLLSLEQVALKTGAGSMEGRLRLEIREGIRELSGDVSSSEIDLMQTRSLWPAKFADGALGRGMQAGSLRIGSVRFDGPFSAWLDQPASWPLKEASLRLAGLKASLTPDLTLADLSTDLAWQSGRINILNGAGRLFDFPFTFSGSVQLPPDNSPAIDAQAKVTMAADRLLALAPREKIGRLTATGPIPLQIALNGSLQNQLIDVQADLGDVVIDLPNLVEKRAEHPASLFCAFSVTDKQIELGHGKLQMDNLEIRGQGFLNRNEIGDFGLDIDVEKVDTAAINDLLPALNRLHPEGAISFHYHLEGQEGRPQRHNGTIVLHQMGFHIVRAVADLHKVSGEIQLHSDHAEMANLSARLGDSPATISGRISNFSDPQIELEVSVPRLRSQDLFFPSTELVLENVVGRLLIDRRHIEFAPVTLAMERGTRVSVKGSVGNYAAPLVQLDIDAEQANLDEVVGLWQGTGRPPPPLAPGTQQPKKHPVTVNISANIRQGTLGGLGSMGDLNFADLEGTINYREGLLTIYPLHFHSGPGFFVGEVAVDNRQGPPPLFKISGHLDRFDAAALHHDLLRRRGLVSGTLIGDFYLQGRLGGQFASTSRGGFDLDIRDGVLRKFQFLSKVFSLLNVSQILTLQLPDMALEGMPFDRLSSSFSLEDGLLSTEDLFVKSNAMNLSLVGNFNVVNTNLDAVLGVKPLRTVDRIITKIPIAGWILAGEEKAIITAQFQIRGPADDPDVVPLPINSVSEKVLGIFRRVLGLPGKMVTDLENLSSGEEKPEGKKSADPGEKMAPAASNP